MKKMWFLLGLVLGTLIVQAQPGTWQARTARPMGGRAGAFAFTHNGLGYVGGGDDDNLNGSSDLWAYDPVADTWTQRASLPAAGRAAAAVFVLGGSAYVAGGELSSSGSTVDVNELWAYDLAANAWAARAPIPGAGRAAAFAFALGNLGYVGGGADFPNAVQHTDLWAYDPVADTWTPRAGFPTGFATLPASFALGGAGYVAGGSNFGMGSALTQQVWRYDPVADQWSARAPLPRVRAYGSSLALGGYGVVVEGLASLQPAVAVRDLLLYDPAADSWTQYPAPGSPSLARMAPYAFGLGNRVYVGSGMDMTNFSVIDDLWAFTLPPLAVRDGRAEAEGFTLAPNPAGGQVWLRGAGAGVVTVLDARGRVVRTVERRSAAAAQDVPVDLRDLPAGVYVVRCGEVMKRLVVGL